MTPAILLVEDSRADEELTARALGLSGVKHRLVVARDGSDALEILLREAGVAGAPLPVAVVLLDLNLPTVSGFEVLKQLRNDPRTRTLPVVILSCSTRYEDVTAAYLLGCNSFLAKLIDFSEFEESMKLLVQYWLVQNVSPELERS